MKEVLGLQAEVMKSPNSSEMGTCGVITKETKYTLHIDGKTIMKMSRIFTINTKTIKGETLIGKYEERIKG